MLIFLLQNDKQMPVYVTILLTEKRGVLTSKVIIKGKAVWWGSQYCNLQQKNRFLRTQRAQFTRKSLHLCTTFRICDSVIIKYIYVVFSDSKSINHALLNNVVA